MNRGESSSEKKKSLMRESKERSRKRQRERETEEQLVERQAIASQSMQTSRRMETRAQSASRRASDATRKQLFRARPVEILAPTLARLPPHRDEVDSFDEQLFEEHDCGHFDVICQFCRSKNFLDERPKDGKFNSCCRKGKIMLQKVKDVHGVEQNYPEFLRSLISNPAVASYNHFRGSIRAYNSAVSFASMGAKIVEMPGRGPYVFKVFTLNFSLLLFKCDTNFSYVI